MGILNQYGYVTTTLSDKITALQNIFKSAFGATINLDPYSPQGQIITYIATLLDNEDKLALNFYDNMDYHNSNGAILSLIAITKGQPRKDGSVASITATLTSSDINYTIPAGSIFESTNTAKQFKTLTDILILNTSQVIPMESVLKEKTGIIITDTLTSISYFSLLTNIEVLTITDGENIETDSELITRLDNSDTETGINDVRAVTDKLNIVDNVQRVRVFDNDLDITVNGIPAHNLICQVVGGLDLDIATTIYNNKATGTPTFGNTSVNIIDSEGYPKIIYFNRPSKKDIYVRVTLQKRNNIPIDTSKFSELKTNTQNFINSLLVGDDVSYSGIFGVWAGQNFDINKLELSFDGMSYVQTDLVIAFTEYASMDNVSNILVITI